MHDPQALSRAAELFKVLGSRSRLELLLAVTDAPASVSALVERTGLSQPLVSQHLRVLRQAGIVTATRTGREAHYAIADRHIEHVVQDALEHALEEPAPDDAHAEGDAP